MTILNCLQSWTTRTQKYLFIIWNEWHLMTIKKCRRKVINDRDMENPYLLIKGFYQWRNYFYLYGWNDFEMCMAVEYIVWVSTTTRTKTSWSDACCLVSQILHFRPHTARRPHSASCCLSIIMPYLCGVRSISIFHSYRLKIFVYNLPISTN